MPGKATFYALGVIVLWSTQALVLANQLIHLNTLVFLTLSFLFAWLFQTIILCIKFRRKTNHENSDTETVSFTFLKPYVIWGLSLYFIYHFLLFGAIKLGPAVIANLFNYTWPLFFVFFIYLLEYYVVKKKLVDNIKRTAFLKLSLGFIGCSLLIGSGGVRFELLNSGFGVILGLIAAIIWAVFSVLMKKNEKQLSGSNGQSVWAIFSFGAVILSLTSLSISGDLHILAVQFKTAILPALYFGLGPLGLAMLWYHKALQANGAGRLGRLMFLTPLLSTILLVAFSTHEQSINFWVVIGAAFVILINMEFGSILRLCSQINNNLHLLINPLVSLYKFILLHSEATRLKIKKTH